MYSIVMVAAMTAAPETPDFFCCKKSYSGCYGCYGGCGGCYGYSCGGCSGCWGYGCGGCSGCHGYVTTYSCFGCSGCYGGYAYGGGCGGYVVPATPGVYIAPAHPGGTTDPAKDPKDAKDLKDGKKGPGGVSIPEGPVAVNSIPSNRGQVVIYAPADAKLFADGQATSLSGSERVFQTPELVAGRDFQYSLKVVYNEAGESKTISKDVVVRAGHRTVVDFNAPTDRVTSAVTVNLPANSKLFVDGVATPGAGGKQTFRTPELTKGKPYVYQFKAEVERDGKMETVSREVTFKGGEPVVVDFVEPTGVRTASR